MAARVVWNAVFRLTSSTVSNSSSSMLWNILSRVIPALLITMSSLPCSPTAASTNSLAAPRSTVLATLTLAVPPASLTRSAVSCTGSASTSLATTAAPSAASRSAVARPIPRPAPVTIATLPSSRPTRHSLPVCRSARQGRRDLLRRRTGPALPGLAVRGVATAVGAELLQLQPVRVVAPVLPGDVVTVLALLAGHGDLRADVGGGHCAGPSFLIWWGTGQGQPAG